MKIAFVGGAPNNIGGAEYQSYLITKYLSIHFDVFYIFPTREVTQSTLMHHNVKYIPIRKGKIWRRILGKDYIFDYIRLNRILNEINPDVIYIRISNAYTYIATKFAKSKRILSIWHASHDMDLFKKRFKFNRTGLFNFADCKFLDYAIQNTNYIVLQTYAQNKLLYNNYGRNADLIFPNSHPVPKEEIFKRKPIKILWVANLKPIKRPEYFVELANSLGEKYDCSFIMIGKPGNPAYQKYLKQRMNGVKNLFYLGERSFESVNEQFADAHIFVNTSESEGFPNTFIQAWMRKVPVVSLNVDPDDVIKKYKLGFHSRTFEQLLDDVVQLIMNEKLRIEMGENAYKYAIQYHSIEKNIDKLVIFLKDIINQKWQK